MKTFIKLALALSGAATLATAVTAQNAPTINFDSAPNPLTLPDDIVVLPGHGEQTSIGRERATNPFLLELQDSGAAGRASRGL